MTREDLAKALALLSETFLAPRGAVLGELAAEGYWMVLKDLTPREMQLACASAIRECEHMPVPAKLLAYVKADRREASLFAETNRQLREIEKYKADPKLLEAIRETVSELAMAKDANRPHVLQREPMVVAEEEKRQTLERAAQLLAARRTS